MLGFCKSFVYRILLSPHENNCFYKVLRFSDGFVRLVFKVNPLLKGLVSSPLFGSSVTIVRLILRN